MDRKILVALQQADKTSRGGLSGATLGFALLNAVGTSCVDEDGRVDIAAFVYLLYGQTSSLVATPSGLATRSTGRKAWKLNDLNFTEEPKLRLHSGTSSYDGEVQYEGRTPAEELDHLENHEAAVYTQALADEGLPASTTNYPWPITAQQAADILRQIREDAVKLYDSTTRRFIPAVSKGFVGMSELHVASLPQSDTKVYKNVVLCCLEEQLSFGVVWEINWQRLWFHVWKLRQQEALGSGKRFLVLTKDDGSVCFNQTIEVAYLRREGIPFQCMRARSLLRQLRPMVQRTWYRDYKTVEKLLDHPLAKELLKQTESSGQSTLHILAQNGKAGLARSVLAAKAEVDDCNFAGQTPLWIASHFGREEMARLLLQGRADPVTADRNGQAPLAEAAMQGHVALARLLLLAQADVQQADQRGYTALCLASQKGQDQVAEVLMAAGAEMDRCTDTGETPLLIASQCGHAALVRRLVAAGADTASENHKGFTALDFARGQGYRDVVARLQAQGPVFSF